MTFLALSNFSNIMRILLVGVWANAESLTLRVSEPAEGTVNRRSGIHASGWGILSLANWAFTLENVLGFALMALKGLSVEEPVESSVRLSFTSFFFRHLVELLVGLSILIPSITQSRVCFALVVIERLNHTRLSQD